MAFTVEDGTGLAAANSYLSVADADSYHADRGNALWTGADPVKQAALVKATDYIEQVYRDTWAGSRNNTTQALEWPRYNMPSGVDGYYMDPNVLPAELKNATAILALDYMVNGDLNPNLDRGGLVKREKTDVLETEYFADATPGISRPSVDGLLSRYLRGSSLNHVVVRT